MSLGGKSKDIICTSSDREVSSALNIFNIISRRTRYAEMLHGVVGKGRAQTLRFVLEEFQMPRNL